MMDFVKENKIFAAIIIGIMVLVGAYFAYNAGNTDQLLTSTGETQTAQVSKELLATLGNLRSLSLDTSLFNDPAFMSLVDFGTDIPLEPVGRDNPFAPLTGVGTRSGATGGVGVPTRVIPIGNKK